MNNAGKTKNIDAINNMNKNYKAFNFKIIKHSAVFFAIAGLIFITGMVSFFTRGFNFDIDFLGGTIMEFNIGRDLNVSDVEDIHAQMDEILGSEMVSSVVRSGSPPQQVIIKTKDLTTDQRNAVFQVLVEKYNITEDDINSSKNVNPTVGDTLRNSTILSLVIATVLMLVYITFRFTFHSGIASVISLVFDLYVMLTFYSLFQISMNTAVIASFLTIMGYSINATIISFDRMRENLKIVKGTKFSELMNTSICQTLMRTINTTFTSFVTLLVLFIMGVPSIRTFVLPMMVGIISALFSSTCLSGPMWNLLHGKDKDTAKAK